MNEQFKDGVSPEAIMEQNRIRFAGKIADQPNFKKNSEPAFYYEECLQEGHKIIQEGKKFSNEIERYMKATNLRYDIISIGQNMLKRITYNGCKQMMIICCQIMYLSYRTAFEEEALNKIVFEHVKKVLNINLSQITSETQLSYGTYCSEDYFNAFDLLINLYYAFGKKDFLNYVVELINKTSNLKVSDEYKSRFENYQVFIEKTLSESWIPPKKDVSLSTKETSPQSTHQKSEGCYIATAVYGSYEAPEVMVLRRFRDLYLQKRVWGKKFIDIYYRSSPELAKKLKHSRYFNSIVRVILNFLVDRLKSKY